MKLVVNGTEVELSVDGVWQPKRKKKTDIRYLKKDNTEYPQYDINVRLVSDKELNEYEKECLSRRITALLCVKEVEE